jgi:transcriptional regulator with XRE-family HTH domain
MNVEKVYLDTKEGQVRLTEVAGISLYKLVQEVGVSYKTVFDWRSGTKPSKSAAMAFAKFFKTPLQYDKKRPVLIFARQNFDKIDNDHISSEISFVNLPKGLRDLIQNDDEMAASNISLDELLDFYQRATVPNEASVSQDTWLQLIKMYRIHKKQVDNVVRENRANYEKTNGK